MDLVPVREQPTETAAVESEAKPSSSAALFTVSPERQQLIGVQFTEVDYRAMEKVIRTVGRVDLDETRIAHVNTKIEGWIDRVFVNYTEQRVERGDPLFTIYSPELVATQREYLLALKARHRLGDHALPQAAAGAISLLEATRERLRLWDITDEQIAELERTGRVKRTLTIYSPVSGYVVEKNAFPHMRVTPDMRLYTIADYGRVWVHADIYEDEIAFVKLGQRAEMTVASYPGEVFEGVVTYIWPHLEEETRTLKIRMEFANPDLKLKPEMYADVKLRIPLGRKLAVPKSAVLRTSERDIVFVDRGRGHMEIRAVRLGHEVDEYYEVRDGLKPGERVVTAANFLISAESQVQGAIATWQASSSQGGEHRD